MEDGSAWNYLPIDIFIFGVLKLQLNEDMPDGGIVEFSDQWSVDCEVFAFEIKILNDEFRILEQQFVIGFGDVANI